MKTRFGLLMGGMAVVVALMLATPKETKAAFGENAPPVGKNCVVQFRRDALGAAAALPVSPLTGSINGAETTVSGKLKIVTSDWIVVDNLKGSDLWISRASILLMQF